MSPALPIARLLFLIAENSGAILTVAGGVGLAYILTRPENKQAINSSLATLSYAVGHVGNQVATMSSPVAIAALRQLSQTRQELRSFQEKLELIDKVLPIAKEFLGKVTRLLKKIDQVSNNLSDRAKVNPLDIQSAPFTFRDSRAPDFPASPNVDDLVRDRATQEVQQQAPPGSQSPPVSSNPFVDSSPPISASRNRSKPKPITIDDPIIPPPDNIIWRPINPEKPLTAPPSNLWPPRDESSTPFPGQNTQPSNGPRYLPSDAKFPPGQIYTGNDPFAHLSARPKTVPRTRSKPRTDTNQPGCKDPNSWSERFKHLLSEAVDYLGQELIQLMADRAGEVFEKAFVARDEAIRKNPDFDKGKPDLRKTLENSIGKEYNTLSSQATLDLKKHYDIKPQPNGKYVISRPNGRGSDPTLPPIQIKNGYIIPELLGNNSRLSAGVDLGKAFADGHGFNPTKSGVLKTAANGQALGQMAEFKALTGPVQIHHKVPDALWQSHPLTQAMQAQINAGNKNIVGLNDSSNLIASYKSPQAKLEYQKMLAEIGKTNPQLQKNIEGSLRNLESGKAMLSDLYHNGSHNGWNERARKALDDQERKLVKKFGTKDLSKIPDKYLNEAYQKATKELGDELSKANEKIKQKQPLDKNEEKWLTPDYCSPKDKQKTNSGTRISVNPDKSTAWDRLVAVTEHFKDLSKKSNDDQLSSTSQNNQSLHADSNSQKALRTSIRSPVWAETMDLANQLKERSKSQSLSPDNTSSYETRQSSKRDPIWAEAMDLANQLKSAHEERLAQKEEQQIALQQQENTKQQKRGFEYGA